MTNKLVCNSCTHHMTTEDMLSAPNPFEPKYLIYACPACKEIEDVRGACDEPGRWEPDTCGTPLADGGYRRTCRKHMPGKELRNEK
jgi:hypothetical protein